MKTRPHPDNPSWESREDFAILCRGVVMDFHRAFALPLPSGGTRSVTPARFHHECWKGPVPPGYAACLPKPSMTPHPSCCWTRPHTSKGNVGCRKRKVLLPFPAYVDRVSREVVSESPDVHVTREGDFWQIHQPGVLRLAIHHDVLMRETLDRDRIISNLTQYRKRGPIEPIKPGKVLHRVQTAARKPTRKSP